jgi:3-methyl-2-oxobutanoate hydroxymethyltransferase
MAPEEIAKLAAEQLKIPTIDVGSGRYTDGQVLIAAEMLGMPKPTLDPYYNKLYENFEERALKALQQFVKEVTSEEFRGERNCRHVKEEEMMKVKQEIGDWQF